MPPVGSGDALAARGGEKRVGVGVLGVSADSSSGGLIVTLGLVSVVGVETCRRGKIFGMNPGTPDFEGTGVLVSEAGVGVDGVTGISRRAGGSLGGWIWGLSGVSWKADCTGIRWRGAGRPDGGPSAGA